MKASVIVATAMGSVRNLRGAGGAGPDDDVRFVPTRVAAPPGGYDCDVIIRFTPGPTPLSRFNIDYIAIAFDEFQKIMLSV